MILLNLFNFFSIWSRTIFDVILIDKISNFYYHLSYHMLFFRREFKYFFFLINFCYIIVTLLENSSLIVLTLRNLTTIVCLSKSSIQINLLIWNIFISISTSSLEIIFNRDFQMCFKLLFIRKTFWYKHIQYLEKNSDIK